MNILLVSESFILREYMENLFHEIIKDAQVNVKIRLSETTKEDLLQTDFVFIDIYDEISKELKIIDYIKIKNKKLKTIVIDRNKNKSTFKKVLKYGIEGYITNTIEKDEFINSINVDYDNSVLKYKEEYIKPLNDILKTTKTIVNNIINEEDTISVVTKQGTEYINHIKDIKHDTVSNISGIETAEVIESIDILKDYGEVVDDVKLNKDCVNAVNDIYVTEQKFASCINEKIKGNLEFVRNGIMLINDDGELTIYSTNKISSINK